jgi:hypothetical protein
MARRMAKWLVPLAGVLTLAGYFGPWVDHPVAALVITGLDLGEYVKFLPAVRDGMVTVWREGFYWPLVAVSLSQSLYAFRPELNFGWPVRAGMLALAVVAALNLLPPAWTPTRLITAEFYLQTSGLVLCLAAMAVSPLLALLPGRMAAFLTVALCGLAAWFPVRDFLRVLPGIGELYNHPLQPAWGMMILGVGLILMAVGTLSIFRKS